MVLAVKALVLGARGAVGRVVADELRAHGHQVTPAGRTPPEGGVRIDLSAPDGPAALRAAAARHDIVVNASGVEDPSIAGWLAGAVLLDISATAAYLTRLAQQAPAEAGLVLGVGLVPGLSTLLLEALDSTPGDDIDLAIMLGGGEAHGPAAIEWTADLAGRPLYEPPEAATVLNLRERRRFHGPLGKRTYLRADFPDHMLIGAPRGIAVRSYLAVDSHIATVALALVGRASSLRPLVRHAPHLGGSRWSLTAQNRRSGQMLSATGDGQSRATGLLAAHAAIAAARLRPVGLVTTADILSLDDMSALPGIELQP